MRMWRLIGVGTATLMLGFVALVGVNLWVQSRMYYPVDSNESSFMRAYDTKPVVQPFMAPHQSSGEGRGSGGGAGTKSTTHHAAFEEYFVMRTDQKEQLILTVREDVRQRLLGSRAQILNQYGTPSAGFHFDYGTPNTVGSVWIHPVLPGNVRRNMPLSAGLEDVSLNVEINEEWFPKGAPKSAFTVARR